METKAPKFVQGYWRNKKEEPTMEAHKGERWMIYLFATYIGLLVLKAAFANPRTAMSLIGIIGVSYGIVQGIKRYGVIKTERTRKQKLIVNEANKSTVIYL